jgi:hypothetical protein
MFALFRRFLRPKPPPKQIGKGPMRADEFITALENDPEYQARLLEMERVRSELRTRCTLDEQPLVVELRALGLRVDSVYDLVNNHPHPVLPTNFVGPYKQAYPLLLRHLAIPHEPNVREGIIRALIVRDLPVDAHSLLLDQLRTEQNRIHRVCLALAFRKAVGRRKASEYPEVVSAIRGGMVG